MSSPHLPELLELLRFPSVSTQSEKQSDMLDCARWLAEKLLGAGLQAEVFSTPGHPVVVARNDHVPGRKTVLIYGHYDVQPVDPIHEWSTPPFDPQIRDGIIYARGATDNKGQIYAHICGVIDTLKEEGALPVNLIFLIEGEEEIGSPNLPEFLRQHRERLKCDVVAISDTGMLGPGVPTFTYALRGIAALEVRVQGPSVDLHSGIYGGGVVNPATVAARIAGALHDSQWRVAIPHFYDSVSPLQEWEREAWAQNSTTEKELLRTSGASMLDGEAGYSSLERIWARPTAEVNGIGGGYQGEGTKTVLPKEAFLKLTFRLVPNQKPAEILALTESFIRQFEVPGVKLEIKAGHSGSPYLMDPHSPFGLAAQRALAKSFGQPAKLIREGGSIPIVETFKEILGVDTLLLGLALPDCRAHAPDENFPVANFDAGIQLNRALLKELAQ